MTTYSGDDSHRDRFQSLALFLIAGLTVAALVLTVLVWRSVAGDARSADSSQPFPLRAEPYGKELTVLLPDSEITFVIGAPVETIEHGLLDVEYDDPRWEDRPDLGAPDGGRLVPLTWRPRLVGAALPVEVRLVAGDQRIDLASLVPGNPSDTNEPRSVAVAVDGEVEVDDLAIEVEYDGLTQTADVASGEVDAGAAQALYEDTRNFSGGCAEVDDQCPLLAVDTDSPVRPRSATFTATYLTLYPYDATLGWAEEGTLWAGVQLHLFGADGVANAEGDYWSTARQAAPTITLDGAEPVHREGLGDATFNSTGRVVFQVETGAEPRELSIEQVLSYLRPGSPGDLKVHAKLELAPVG